MSSKSFDEMNFEAFRKLAENEALSKYEKIGFPDSYRQGFEESIFNDICSKLTNLHTTKKNVLDIGPGCSDLPKMLIELCEENQHHLYLIDSLEMLGHLPDKEFVSKVPALFPDCDEIIDQLRASVDVILAYSILHYVFVDVAFHKFIDTALTLLAPGGQLLIGDIPNISKRKRFFSSEAGVEFHKNFMSTASKPKVEFNCVDEGHIDDSVVFSVLQRARSSGFDAYVVPQNSALPLSNRREDILILKP